MHCHVIDRSDTVRSVADQQVQERDEERGEEIAELERARMEVELARDDARLRAQEAAALRAELQVGWG